MQKFQYIFCHASHFLFFANFDKLSLQILMWQYKLIFLDLLFFFQREGFSKYNKIYEFDYRLQNQNVNMTMTSVSGHLLNFEFTGHFRKWYES